MITLFSIPKPFRGHAGVIQRNAVKSWTLLHPDVEVILFGEEEGLAGAAGELGVRHEPHVNRNEYGTPLLNSVFDRAQEIARHPILCYVNCDILLLNDFCAAVSRVAAWRDKFLMVGRRWDTDIRELIDFSHPDWGERLRLLALRTNNQRPPVWIDYFTFRRGQYYHNVPPFAVGRPRWDQWMIWFARSSRTPVVDASQSVMAIHQNHDYSHYPLGFQGVMGGEEAKRNEELAGALPHFFTIEHAPYRLGKNGLKWNSRHLFIRFDAPRKAVRDFFSPARAILSSAWYAILRVTLPVRHVLGLRRKRVAESRSNP